MAVYNESFRVKIVEFLSGGHTYQETAEIFGVSIRSICTWNKMVKQGKKLKFKKVPRNPHRVNYEKLLAYVKEQCIFTGNFITFFIGYNDDLDGVEASGSEI